MNTVELLDKKIEELSTRVNNLSGTDMLLQQQINNNILIVDVALDALTFEDELLSDEDKFLNYNFEGVISLISGHDMEIQGIIKTIRDVKTLIGMRQSGEYNGAYSENQTNQLSKFIENLKQLKEKLTSELQKMSSNEETELLRLELEALRDEMNSPRKRKNITSDMSESLYNGYDILNADPKEVEDLFEGLYSVQGGRIRNVVQRADFKDVLELYKEFVSPERYELFENLLHKFRDEITANIDLDNSRAILEFFKDTGILDSFERRILLNVSLYGDPEYVKTIYERIISNSNSDKDIYFQDLLSSAWICKERRHKRLSSGTRKKNSDSIRIKPLVSECFNFTYDDFLKNSNILAENIDILDLHNPEVLGAHLKAQTLSAEAIKGNESFISVMNENTGEFRKNIAVGRVLGLGKQYKIPVSFFRSDAEDRLHSLIELGLLNPPITEEYIKYEDSIHLTDRFKANHPNESIRNYYSRYMSKLSILSEDDYDYMFVKLHDVGPEQFYKDFFSYKRAGEGSGIYLEDRANMDENNLKEMVANKFVRDWYPAYINNFDRYDLDISDYNEQLKYSSDIKTSYYDENILTDPLIQSLEERHCINDKVLENSNTKEVKNNSVYMFGNTIISRYKVLKNASILKNKYGYLDEDMLLSSIVRNSYLTEEVFQNIYDEAYGRSTTL